MLERADRLSVAGGVTLPVVQVEDIIGLKVQATVNNPRRVTKDWSDIRMLVEVSAEQQLALDWNLLTDYLTLFGLTDRVQEMKVWYGEFNGE
jgi:predicted nucleotidyltransferase|tara:strand:+ start:4568 stop:4843 length:276 start_codon:yes stop_codon:yes gene_type:complete